MMTLWNETEQIEAYLLGLPDTGNKLVFEARMLLDPTLSDNVLWQQKTYQVIQQYGRNQLKQEIENVHQQLFHHPEHIGFREKIRRLFTKQ